VATSVPLPGRPTLMPKAIRRFLRNGLAVFGLLAVIAFLTIALTAPVITQFPPNEVSYTDITKAPSPQHWFGTDELGRDVFARVVYGARLSLSVGFLAILFASIAGTFFGIVSGFLGGWIDEIIMRLVDAMLALPFLVLAIVVAAVLGPSLQNTILAIAIVSLPGFARIARGEVLAVKERDFVQAANALGAGVPRTLLRHILPNISGPLIVQVTLGVAQAILTESSLSFLGLGVQPPTPAWGVMLNTAKGYLDIAPWMALFPGLAIFLAVLGLSLLGDGLREAFNPRQRA